MWSIVSALVLLQESAGEPMVVRCRMVAIGHVGILTAGGGQVVCSHTLVECYLCMERRGGSDARAEGCERDW